MKVAFLGAGNMRVAPQVVGALATACGERPLDIYLFESDPDRLDLIERFARVCVQRTDYGHSVTATDQAQEAVMAAPLVILAIDEPGVVAWQNPREPMEERGEAYRPSDWSTDSWVIAGQGDRRADEERLIEDLESLRRSESRWVWLAESLIPPAAFLGDDAALDWPTELCAESPELVPHQLLRWIKEDDSLVDWLKKFDHHPLKAEIDRIERRS